MNIYVFFMNSSLVSIEGKLDSLTESFWQDLSLKYRQISQLWVFTEASGGWRKSDRASLLIHPSVQRVLKEHAKITQGVFKEHFFKSILF